MSTFKWWPKLSCKRCKFGAHQPFGWRRRHTSFACRSNKYCRTHAEDHKQSGTQPCWSCLYGLVKSYTNETWKWKSVSKYGGKFRQIHWHILPRKIQQERCTSSLSCICVVQFEPTSCCEKVLLIVLLISYQLLTGLFFLSLSYILDPSRSCLQRLVSFTDYKDSICRRGAILGLIKNCCFETGKLLPECKCDSNL